MPRSCWQFLSCKMIQFVLLQSPILAMSSVNTQNPLAKQTVLLLRITFASEHAILLLKSHVFLHILHVVYWAYFTGQITAFFEAIAQGTMWHASERETPVSSGSQQKPRTPSWSLDSWGFTADVCIYIYIHTLVIHIMHIYIFKCIRILMYI